MIRMDLSVLKSSGLAERAILPGKMLRALCDEIEALREVEQAALEENRIEYGPKLRAALAKLPWLEAKP